MPELRSRAREKAIDALNTANNTTLDKPILLAYWFSVAIVEALLSIADAIDRKQIRDE